MEKERVAGNLASLGGQRFSSAVRGCRHSFQVYLQGSASPGPGDESQGAAAVSPAVRGAGPRTIGQDCAPLAAVVLRKKSGPIAGQAISDAWLR